MKTDNRPDPDPEEDPNEEPQEVDRPEPDRRAFLKGTVTHFSALFVGASLSAARGPQLECGTYIHQWPPGSGSTLVTDSDCNPQSSPDADCGLPVTEGNPNQGASMDSGCGQAIVQGNPSVAPDHDCAMPAPAGTMEGATNTDSACNKPATTDPVTGDVLTIFTDLDCAAPGYAGSYHQDNSCGSLKNPGDGSGYYRDASCNLLRPAGGKYPDMDCGLPSGGPLPHRDSDCGQPPIFYPDNLDI